MYITIETVLCVLLPFSFRHYCNRKNTIWLLAWSLFISTMLHFSFLCTHNTTSKIQLDTIFSNPLDSESALWSATPSASKCWRLTQNYSIEGKNLVWEKVYYWIHMIISIVLPTLAMLLCTILIVQRFTFKVINLNIIIIPKYTLKKIF